MVSVPRSALDARRRLHDHLLLEHRRQHDRKGGAFTGPAADPHRAARLAHDAVHRREAQAGAAIALGRVEGLEDAGRHLGRHADAGVGHAQVDVVARLQAVVAGLGRRQGMAAGADRQPPALGHRIAGVDRQVHQYLRHLARVHAHELGAGVGPDLQPHVLADHAAEHLGDVVDDDVQIHHARRHVGLASEGQELAGERGGAIGGAADLVHGAAALVGGPRAQRLAPAVDHRQQVVEVVGHAAGQLAHRVHLARLAQLLFEMRAFGDVANEPGDVLLAVGGKRRHRQLHREPRAVAANPHRGQRADAWYRPRARRNRRGAGDRAAASASRRAAPPCRRAVQPNVDSAARLNNWMMPPSSTATMASCGGIEDGPGEGVVLRAVAEQRLEAGGVSQRRHRVGGQRRVSIRFAATAIAIARSSAVSAVARDTASATVARSAFACGELAHWSDSSSQCPPITSRRLLNSWTRRRTSAECACRSIAAPELVSVNRRSGLTASTRPRPSTVRRSGDRPRG